MFVLKHWYCSNKTWLSSLLLPLSYGFQWIVKERRKYQARHQYKSRVPIIVIGNIVLGGTGKTPVVEAICKFLHERSYIPAIVSRGVGGSCQNYPLLINENTTPFISGDEPYMLYQKLKGCIPIIIDSNRVRAITYIEDNFPEINIIISDDGLQHYRMARSIEIIVVDGARGFGNGLCLPAGPLREPITRLSQVDVVIINGFSNYMFQCHNYYINLIPKYLVNLKTQEKKPIDYLINGHYSSHVHGVAAIGNPDRFFTALSVIGYQVIAHSFRDHHRYRFSDFKFNNPNVPIVMTHKDAVKCQRFAQAHWWYLKVYASIENSFFDFLIHKLNNKASINST